MSAFQTALLENSCKLAHLKYLQLDLFMSFEDVDNIPSLYYFLRAAPLIEKFELHVSTVYFFYFQNLFFTLGACCCCGCIFRMLWIYVCHYYLFPFFPFSFFPRNFVSVQMERYLTIHVSSKNWSCSPVFMKPMNTCSSIRVWPHHTWT